MANVDQLRKNLEARGFQTSLFESAEEACAYLNGAIDGTTVGFGGSMTLQDMGLYDSLSSHNTCLWHWKGDSPAAANAAPVYISSVNGVAETGELINIDGGCNRVSGIMFGHQKLYLVIGINKIAEDEASALWRARNIAAPRNAQRLNRKTPCAVKGDRCYDCLSPECLCSAIVTLRRRPLSVAEAEVIIINRELGY